MSDKKAKSKPGKKAPDQVEANAVGKNAGAAELAAGSGPLPDETEATTKVWTSGDWREVPRNEPPYNGLRITAVYGGDMAPDVVKVTFDDFTNDKTGVSTTIDDLTVADGWVEVPQPAKKSEAGADGPTFTVAGSVRIQKEVNGKFLRISLSYGAKDQERNERGFIFSVD